MTNRVQRKFLATLAFAVAAASAMPFGLQTGFLAQKEDNGSSYGGSMVYDSSSQVLFLTGATYGSYFSVENADATDFSSCFVGILSLTNGEPEWLHTSRLGTVTVTESCGPIAKVDASKLYIGGQSEAGGLLTGLRGPGSLRATQYGFVGDLDVDLRDADLSAGRTSVQFLGGRLIHSSEIQSVVALTTTLLGDAVFVASHESDESSFHSSYNASNSEPNLSTGGVTKFGKDYFVNVMRFPAKAEAPGNSTQETLLSPSWTEEIATEGFVDVAGLVLYNSSALMLAGTVVGSNAQAIPPNGISLSTDRDGYVIILDPANGFILGSIRVQSQRGKDDTVEDICFQDGSKQHFYVVGSTTGVVDLSLGSRDEETYTAYIMKVRAADQEVVWTAQLVAEFSDLSSNPTGPQMRGLSCAVTNDGTSIYFGGVVESGDTVSQPGNFESAGRDDVFVAQVSADTGSFDFIKQFGSIHDDYLVDMAVDEDGNALVFGNTQGPLFRQKDEASTLSDVFLMSLTRNTGDFKPLISAPVTTQPVSTSAPVTPQPANHPTHAPVITTPPKPGFTTGPTPKTAAPSPGPTPGPSVERTTINSGNRSANGGLIAVMVVMMVCGTILTCFLCRRRMAHDIHTDRDQVLEYLKGFDDVEVDLRHSATGGWHGTYINHDGAPRYYNESGMSDTTVSFSGSEMSSLTHNEIVRDSLFTDDYEEPQLGGGGGGNVGIGISVGGGGGGSVSAGLERPPSSYGGLVNAYNTSWDDMNPYTLPSSNRGSLASNRSSMASQLGGSQVSGSQRQSLTPDLQDVSIHEDEAWGKEIV